MLTGYTAASGVTQQLGVLAADKVQHPKLQASSEIDVVGTTNQPVSFHHRQLTDSATSQQSWVHVQAAATTHAPAADSHTP